MIIDDYVNTDSRS